MSDSKAEILASLRKQLPQATELPSLDQNWTVFDDPLQTFGETLSMVGGKLELAADPQLAGRFLTDLAGELKAEKIYSRHPELISTSFDDSTLTDPHQLEDVDLAVLPGRFGVAENGAVWVDGADLGLRVILFIAQHVVLTVPRNEFVSNMYEAYQRLDWQNANFGVFVSGPSKTADIEQSLVIGAHGARSLTVLACDWE